MPVFGIFNLDVDVKKTDWRGQVEIGQAGPRLTLTAAW
jgi:hypothetical protein